MNSVFGDIGASVFEAMSRIARDHGAVKLGHGFPDGFCFPKSDGTLDAALARLAQAAAAPATC
jgi:N-succinyldiaminopimelate aminotransferase